MVLTLKIHPQDFSLFSETINGNPTEGNVFWIFSYTSQILHSVVVVIIIKFDLSIAIYCCFCSTVVWSIEVLWIEDSDGKCSARAYSIRITLEFFIPLIFIHCLSRLSEKFKFPFFGFNLHSHQFNYTVSEFRVVHLYTNWE